MASLNATDANMPVALESFDECANNPNDENQMATDDSEKDSVKDDENCIAKDALIDTLDDNGNDHNVTGNKTIDHIKGMINSTDQTTIDRPQHQSVSTSDYSFLYLQYIYKNIFVFLHQPDHYNEQMHDNTNANVSQTNPITENHSPNTNPLHERNNDNDTDDMIDRVNSENDVNELDKIFCDKNANSATSDNDDSRSIPGIEDSDDITNDDEEDDDDDDDDQKDSNSLETSNTANTNANLDRNVYSDVDHQQQHQEVNYVFLH